MDSHLISAFAALWDMWRSSGGFGDRKGRSVVWFRISKDASYHLHLMIVVVARTHTYSYAVLE